MSEILFIVGPYKTGTSTLLGMLNCHESIYIEYEVFGNENYRKIFLDKYPNLHSFFSTGDILGMYHELSIKTGYRIIGEKIATLNKNIFNAIGENKVIFIIRDIKTWIAKRESLESLMIPDCTWPDDFLNRYMQLFLSSFFVDNCLHITMEDLLYDTNNTLRRVEGFVGLNGIVDSSNEWYKKIGRWDDDQKCMMRWWEKHPSSLSKPVKKDPISVEVSKTISDIFYKYYHNLNANYDKEEVLKDLEKIKE